MKHYYIGIDEVGRGPLAGPVAVGAVFATEEKLKQFSSIKESKQLSEKKREEWNKKILAAEDSNLRCRVSFVSAERIDVIGIASAIKEALLKSIQSLHADPKEVKVLLDGGLHAPAEYGDQETIIKGDTKEVVIAMASVVAKVARDQYMMEISAQYPLYDFAKHKGYGTKAHCDVVIRHGLTKEHRQSFCRNLITN